MSLLSPRQGRHPEQISDALGAAANQIGPNTIALGVELNKSMGASDGKVSKFFADAFGLPVNRKISGGNRSRAGARAQAVLTTVLRTAYQRGIDAVKLFVDLLRSPDPEQFAALALGP